MFKKTLALLLAALCMVGTAVAVAAAEVDCDAVYCFTASDFSGDDTLSGICITELPDASAGTVLLGTRVLRPGDILTAEQVEQMTFTPLRTETDQDAVVTYLPIYPDRVEPCASMTIAIRGKEDKAPVAEDMALETYKNLPAQGAVGGMCPSIPTAPSLIPPGKTRWAPIPSPSPLRILPGMCPGRLR